MNSSELDWQTLLNIHRYEDGYVGILRQKAGAKAGEPEQLWMVAPSQLRGVFDFYRDELRQGYATTQGYAKAGPWKDQRTGLPVIGVDKKNLRLKIPPRWGRNIQNIRWLNCLSVDIDCGRTEEEAAERKCPAMAMSADDVLAVLTRMIADQSIPPISIYGNSGRGVYAFWLLRDENNPGRSVPGGQHNIPLWKQIQKNIVDCLSQNGLPADQKGSLPTQYLKIGGHVHQKTGKPCTYSVVPPTRETDSITLRLERGTGELISYTLSDMAAWCGLSLPDGPLETHARALGTRGYLRRPKGGKCPNRKAGYYARYRKTAADILAIHAYRLRDGSGGWVKRQGRYADGHSTDWGRRMILTLYAQCLVRSHFSPSECKGREHVPGDLYDDWINQLRAMAAQCSPPWPDPEDGPTLNVESVLDDAIREFEPVAPRFLGKTSAADIFPGNKTLCAIFNVDAGLADVLELKTIRPRDPKTLRKREEIRAEQIARREALRVFLLQHPGKECTLRAVREWATEGLIPGYSASHETVRADVYALFPKTPRRRKRRIPGPALPLEPISLAPAPGGTESGA